MKFENEILEIEKRISELESFSKLKNINLNIEIQKEIKKRDSLLKEAYSNLSSWDKVLIARDPNRPYTLDYIELLTENFVELHGDRLYKDDHSIIGGLGQIEGKSIMIIGHQKGRSTEEKLFRNFGMANPEGYRKVLRLLKLAEKFKIPVLTLIDTPGAYPGIEAEKHGQGEAIARNLMEMSGIKTPLISIIIGEGGSGGALGLGVTDKIFMLENSVYSVISPEGCAAILYNNPDKIMEAAENLKMSAQDLLNLKIIDKIIPEALGGAHRNYQLTADNLKKVVLQSFAELMKLSPNELLENRYKKFRTIGEFYEN